MDNQISKTNIKVSKLTSFKSKETRRAKKYSNILQRQFNLQCTDNFTTILAVCNAGLATGISREMLLNLFLPYGTIRNLVLLPGKSVCFVEFSSETSACQAHQALHGAHIEQLQQLGPLFLLFVDKVPAMEEEGVSRELPPGLSLIADVVTQEEEDLLLASVQWDTEDPRAAQALKHRRVRHYGFQFDYSTNHTHPDEPLSDPFPGPCDVLLDRLQAQGTLPWRPDQLTVNQYQPGQGIPPHVDTHSAFEDPILSLSLGAAVVMEFRRADKTVPVLLPRRSLLVMAGEARYCWSHGITSRKTDVVPCSEGGLTLQERGVRTSFTFRKLRGGPCDCCYPQHCDSRQSETPQGQSASEEPSAGLAEETAAQLEALHVHQVYEQIASHFSATRHTPWPKVQEFVQSQSPGSVLLDVGCGNGKYLGLNPSTYQVGCDSSSQLIRTCRDRGFEVLTCNCLRLPWRSGSVDCCISIAVLHHLATQERRVRALSEMARVLRPGGEALVYVWARDQQRGNVKSSYLRQGAHQGTRHGECVGEEPQPTSPFALPVHTNRTQFAHADMLVPWKLRPPKGEGSESSACREAQQEVFYRYYHVFDEPELAQLCAQVPSLHTLRTYYDQGNWCAHLQKL